MKSQPFRVYHALGDGSCLIQDLLGRKTLGTGYRASVPSCSYIDGLAFGCSSIVDV